MTRARQRRPLWGLALAFAAGVALGHLAPGGVWSWVLGFGGALAALIYGLAQRWPSAVMITLIFAATIGAGALRLRWSRAPGDPGDVNALSLPEDRVITVRARVTDPPLPVNAHPGAPAPHFGVEVRAVQTELGWLPLSGSARVIAPRFFPEARYDAELECSGFWRPPEKPDDHLAEVSERARRDAFRTGALVLSPAHGLRLHRAASGAHPLGLVHRLRSRFLGALFDALPYQDASLYAAFVAGEKRYLTEETRSDFEKSGTMHLLAVSGLHVLLALAGWHWVLGLCGVRARGRAVASLGFLLAYCAFTGAAPSVVRATVLGVVAVVAPLLHRRALNLNVLGFAALGMLLLDPEDLFAPGFQLSYLAMIGLFLSGRLFPSRRSAPRYEPGALPGPRFLAARVAYRLRRSFWMGVSVTLITAPVLLFHFHLVTPLTPVFNLAAIPALSVALAQGFAMLACALLLGDIPALVARTAHWGAQGMSAMLGFFARLPGAFSNAFDIPKVLLALSLALIAFLTLTRLRLRPAWTYSGALAMACLIVAGNLLTHPSPRELSITAFDVGHGACMLVTTPEGGTLLYDCGSFPKRRDLVSRHIAVALWRRGVQTIDVLALSHPNADHINAVLDLGDRLDIGLVLAPRRFDAVPGGARLLREMERRGVPVRLLHRDTRLPPWSGIEWRVLNPGPDPLLGKALAPNDLSLVLELGVGEHRMLLTGDLEDRGLASMLLGPMAKRRSAQVMLAPHHGSALDQQARLLERVAPRWVLISGRTRFMDPAALERYRAATNPDQGVLTTAQNGAITLALRAGRWQAFSERASPP